METFNWVEIFVQGQLLKLFDVHTNGQEQMVNAENMDIKSF